MNCDKATQYIEGTSLPINHSKLDEEFLIHIKQCDTCNTCFQQHQVYLTSIKQMKTPNMSPSSASRMFRHVRQQATEQRIKPARSSFMQGFVAASVLALAILGSWSTWQNHTNKQEIVASPTYITTEVVLVINAPEDIYDADLNLELPSKVALIGYENSPELTWPIDLKKGVNTLSLPIKVQSNETAQQPFSITAKLYHYTEEREFEIKVDLSKA